MQRGESGQRGVDLDIESEEPRRGTMDNRWSEPFWVVQMQRGGLTAIKESALK